MSVIDDIRGLLADKAGELYGGEDVTQEQHALQCAAVAEADGASSAMDAVRLRRWDDTGKDPATQTAPLDHYLGIVAQVLAHSAAR